MHAIIQSKLKHIESDHNVVILLAIESGSRAWGFPSEDSDYDVRFIYTHTPDWYLSISKHRDVIELPIDPVWDINGWDIKKALQLLRKSNPTIMEWLTSPIIYREHTLACAPLKALAEQAFMPLSSCAHYFSMAKNNMAKYQGKNTVKIKSYLYSLRPILCYRWVIEHHSQPPMLFATLLDTYLPASHMRDEIDHLLRLKQNSNEQDTVDKSALIETYIDQQISVLTPKLPDNPAKANIELFDAVFRQILGLCYPTGGNI